MRERILVTRNKRMKRSLRRDRKLHVLAIAFATCASACDGATQRASTTPAPNVTEDAATNEPSLIDASNPDGPTHIFDADITDGGELECGRVELRATRLTSAVHLLLEITSTLNVSFPGGSPPRWQVLTETLFDPDAGVVPPIASSVLFSLTLYKSLEGGAQECPVLTRVPLAFDNTDAMREACEAAVLNGDAPAAPALQHVAQLAAAERHEVPIGRQRIVLALSELAAPCGYDPDHSACDALPAGEVVPCQVAIDRELRLMAMEDLADAAAEAHELGIEVLVLNISEPDSPSYDALQRVANEGVGLPRDGAELAPFYFVEDVAQLQAAVADIAETSASCHLAVEGRLVLSRACEGEVQLNGEPLPCDDPDGWRPIDAGRIELLGDACRSWQTASDARLEGSFPCGALIPPE